MSSSSDHSAHTKDDILKLSIASIKAEIDFLRDDGKATAKLKEVTRGGMLEDYLDFDVEFSGPNSKYNGTLHLHPSAKGVVGYLLSSQ